MKTMPCARLFVLATVCSFASHAFGSSINVASTGSSGGTALAYGVTDPNYTLISAPSGVPLSAITTSPNAAWYSGSSSADWISPSSSGSSSFPVGTYIYQTTFNLTGDNPATAELNLLFASDNSACIYLNGTNTGDCTGDAAFGSLADFNITSGFVSGVNTLDFEVYDSEYSPTGVYAQVSGTVTASGPSAVPEPSALLLVATGLTSVGGLLRRKLTR